MTNGCISAGPHSNPLNKRHGGPNDEDRHVGDLGNLIAEDHGFVRFDIKNDLIRLDGPHSIVGRAIVVRSDPDDFGKGWLLWLFKNNKGDAYLIRNFSWI
jgi:Cu-Zn family superoxide dismutase